MDNFATWFYSPEDLRARFGRSANLFCFPFAGAGSWTYHSLCKAFPSYLMPFAARLPGRETSRLSPPITDIREIVGHLSTAILPVLDERPAIFWGHSMGALIGFELARALRSRGAPKLLVVSGRGAPQIPLRRRPVPIEHLSDEEFIQVFREYDGTPQAVLEDRDVLNLFLPQLRADFAALESYTYLQGERLDCDILCLNGESDSMISRASAQAWGDQTSGEFCCEWLPGGHFFINDEQTITVRRISDAITSVLGRAGVMP